MNRYASKLLIEDDSDEDLVKFTFPNETRKIKCSRSMLSDISDVFKTMFSERWCKEKHSIQLNDEVNFNQYKAFKLFVEILYGMRQVSSLTVHEACVTYFYAHKYHIMDLPDEIIEQLELRLKRSVVEPLHFAELTDFIEFAATYQLIDFVKQLECVKLGLNSVNHKQFFQVVHELGLNNLKQQVVNYLKTIEPKSDWCPEALQAVIMGLRQDKLDLEEEVRRRYIHEQRIAAEIAKSYSLCKACGAINISYCSYCKNPLH